MARSPLSIKATTRDDSKDLDRILKEVQDPRFDAVDIGVLSDEDENLRIYASANEFGTRNGHIPERSFIRSAVDENESQINQRADRVYRRIIDGKLKKREGLGQMGEFIQSLVTRKITTLRHPENKESTIARKGSSNPLIDSNRLRSSIRWELANSKQGAGI